MPASPRYFTEEDMKPNTTQYSAPRAPFAKHDPHRDPCTTSEHYFAERGLI
jgi:hypothetical protein